MDKIDKRYAWLKRHLLDFEDKYGKVFPSDWEVSERITVQFCTITRDELAKIMSKRRVEIDVKLLLFAISKTSTFELLLTKRFTGATFSESNGNGGLYNILITCCFFFLIINILILESEKSSSPFVDLIGTCFRAYLDIYTDSIDRNLVEIIERFVQDSKIAFDPTVNNSTVFPRYTFFHKIKFFSEPNNISSNFAFKVVPICLCSTKNVWSSVPN